MCNRIYLNITKSKIRIINGLKSWIKKRKTIITVKHTQKYIIVDIYHVNL